jgi:hypothetical protein
VIGQGGSAAQPGTPLHTHEVLLAELRARFDSWREAWNDWIASAPAFAILAPPAPIYIWGIESGELDTDVSGGDDPADQVYFAVREGLIKIGFSGSPRRRLSRACTLTRTVAGGSLQEAMLHHLFGESQVWREDRPERSSAEWYRPTPLLVKLAKAENVLAREAADASMRRLFAQFWRERYPDGFQIVVQPKTNSRSGHPTRPSRSESDEVAESVG